jgi:hypothetical protein
MSLLLDDETKLGKGNKVVVSCFTPSGHCLKHTRRKSEGVVNPVEGEAGDIKIYDCATHEFIPLGTLARYLEAAGERDFDWSYYASTDALRATAKGKDEIAKLFPFEPQQLLCNTGLSVEKGNDNLVFGKRADENFFDGASRANEMIPERDDTFLLRNFLRNKHGVSLAATQITPPSLVFAAQIAAKQGGKDFS